MLMNTQRKMTKKQVRLWVEGEVQSQMDSYKNTRQEALRFVQDLLEEGEYQSNDEISGSDAVSALVIIRTLRQQS